MLWPLTQIKFKKWICDSILSDQNVKRNSGQQYLHSLSNRTVEKAGSIWSISPTTSLVPIDDCYEFHPDPVWLILPGRATRNIARGVTGTSRGLVLNTTGCLTRGLVNSTRLPILPLTVIPSIHKPSLHKAKNMSRRWRPGEHAKRQYFSPHLGLLGTS